MISFYNTETNILAIPEGADIYHRSRVFKAAKQLYGAFDIIRHGIGNRGYNMAFVDFDSDTQLLVMETCAKLKGWTWEQFYQVVRATNIAPINGGDIDKVKVINLT